jgi:hypothetical protein
VASAVSSCQTVFGHIPTIVAIGENACHVKTLFDALPKTETNAKKQINAAVIIDRNLDLVTPLLTQISYEGEKF